MIRKITPGMKKRKVIVGMITAMLFSLTAFGQNPQTSPTTSFLPKAPNTATLGKFGDYSVSMFSGVPQISIPIYTIKTSGFEVPITIDYHASGIKVGEYPSWVGAGWALNAGGTIRRQLVGKPDEEVGNNSFLSGQPKKSIDLNPFSSSPQGIADYDYINNLNKGVIDYGADIFSYSLPTGQGGKFFFDRDDSFKPVLMPYAPLKVAAFPSSGESFIIHDQGGNRFDFGKDNMEIGFMTGVFGGSISMVSAWMLERMISSTKLDTIYFTYQTQYDIGPFERSDISPVDDMTQSYPYGYKSQSSCVGCQDWYSSLTDAGLYSPSYGTFSAEYSRSEVGSAVNSEIRFTNGKVVFEQESSNRQDFGATGNKALGKIKVYEKQNGAYVLIKTISLVHSYFIDGVDNNSKRLRLDSVRMEDSQSKLVSSYAFNYNTTVNLPHGNVNSAVNASVSKDFWGYYNGQSNNILTPQTVVAYNPLLSTSAGSGNFTIGSTNSVGREPNETYMQAAILKKITFPTGGHTEFEYEANRYLDDNSNPKLAGGLRIKSIKSYDGITSTPIIKTYKYGENESGYGRRNFFNPDLFFSDDVQYEMYSYSVNCCDPYPRDGAHTLASVKRHRTYFSNPTIGMTSADGMPVTYAHVTEYLGEGTNVLGKTMYVFRDAVDDVAQIGSTATAIPITRGFDRGQLLSKTVYKKNGSGVFQKVEKEVNTYNTSFPLRSKFGGLLLRKNIVREGMFDYLGFQVPLQVRTSNDWTYNNFYYATDDNYLTASTKTIYNADSETEYLTTTTSYSYANELHQQPTSITTTNSKGEVWVDEFRYPADYIVSGGVTNNAVLDAMLQKNMQAYPVEQWRRKGAGSVVIGGSLNLYKQLSNGLIVIDKQKRLGIRGSISDYQTASVVSTALQTDSRFDPVTNFVLYDLRGNVLELQKENDVKEVYLWGYNGQYPVAKVLNSDYSTVSSYVTQSILDNPANDHALRQHLNGLRTSLPSKQIVTFTFAPLTGVTSQSDVRGRLSHYFYDNIGRLSFIRDHDNNVIKRICYNYYGQPEDCGCASTTANWQNTATAIRCRVSGLYNTGEQEQERRDVNPCSPTYNQLQWVVIGTNTTACPLPCESFCSGEDKKCVNGICETGTKVYTSCVYNWSTGMYDNTYHYEFSDSSWSINYYESTYFAPCLE